MKKYLSILTLIVLFFTSCEEYLKEEPKSIVSVETAFTSEAGVESLVAGAYLALRAWYGLENGWDFSEAGTDIFTYANDSRSPAFFTYSSILAQEEEGRCSAVWSELYASIQTCNVFLSNTDKMEALDVTTLKAREGEVLFLRAHYLWQIAEVWGGVVLDTMPTNTVNHYAERSSVDDFYDVIFSDLNSSLSILSGVPNQENGRINAVIVEAFLARMHLTRGNYAEAKQYADNVINTDGLALMDNWNDIWALNTETTEMVWPIMWSDNSTTRLAGFKDFSDYDDDTQDYTLWEKSGGINQRDGGQQGHVTFNMRYENFNLVDGVDRNIIDGRGYTRFMPTRFFIELFDETVDERFKGSFKDHWLCNMKRNDENAIWDEQHIVNGEIVDIDPALVGQDRFDIGDTAIFFSKHPIDSANKAKSSNRKNGMGDYYHITEGYFIFDIDDMYELLPNGTYANRLLYFPLYKKYQDTTYTDMVTQTFSQRDIYAIRLSEMYLISAEASLLGAGGADEAYNTLLDLANARSFDGDGAALLGAYNVTSGNDIDIDFILDERARELGSEGLRWFDLKRTGKLVERAKLHNPDCQNITENANLRFIPQSQLDALYNGAEFGQNPGYN